MKEKVFTLGLSGKQQFLVAAIIYGSIFLATTFWGFQALSFKTILALLGSGFIGWTFIEYVLHRFPFHYEAAPEPWRTILAGQHLFHHEYPNHPDFVIAPITISLPMYGLIFLLFWGLSAAFGSDLLHASLLGSGLQLGYLVYEWIHYSAHRLPARTALGRYLKKYHMVHHFKDSDNYFGVTSPFWDRVFGTKPDYDSRKETRILPIASRGKNEDIAGMMMASKKKEADELPLGRPLLWQSLIHTEMGI